MSSFRWIALLDVVDFPITSDMTNRETQLLKPSKFEQYSVTKNNIRTVTRVITEI